MSKEKVNLCQECAGKITESGSEITIVKGFSFGLHKCSVCGVMIPTQECEVERSCVVCG